MKRTTISRSDLAVLAALLAAPAAGREAAAQDTLQVAQDTARAVPQGREHVVREGETLWAISQLYLRDPFLWPAIYRLNTLVVEDPHWIFPGEVLRLVPPDTTVVAVGEPQPPAEGELVQRPPGEAPPVEAPDAAPPPPPVFEAGATVFRRGPRGAGAGGMTFDEMMPYWPVRRGEFYAAGFLTEGEDLPWAEVLGPVRGGRIVAERASASSGMLFEQVRIRGASGATYQIGDSLLTARLARDVDGGWGKVVVPTGIVRVIHVSGRDVVTEIVTQFSRVMDGQVAIPIEPFRNPGSVRPLPVQEGIAGEVITPRDIRVVPNQQNVVFIDLGREDGIVPGDVFEAIRGPTEATVEGQPPERLGLLHIVHVRNRSASGLLLHIMDPDIEAGVPVRLIRKMPS